MALKDQLPLFGFLCVSLIVLVTVCVVFCCRAKFVAARHGGWSWMCRLRWRIIMEDIHQPPPVVHQLTIALTHRQSSHFILQPNTIETQITVSFSFQIWDLTNWCYRILRHYVKKLLPRTSSVVVRISTTCQILVTSQWQTEVIFMKWNRPCLGQ